MFSLAVHAGCAAGNLDKFYPSPPSRLSRRFTILAAADSRVAQSCMILVASCVRGCTDAASTRPLAACNMAATCPVASLLRLRNAAALRRVTLSTVSSRTTRRLDRTLTLKYARHVIIEMTIMLANTAFIFFVWLLYGAEQKNNGS